MRKTGLVPLDWQMFVSILVNFFIVLGAWQHNYTQTQQTNTHFHTWTRLRRATWLNVKSAMHYRFAYKFIEHVKRKISLKKLFNFFRVFKIT